MRAIAPGKIILSGEHAVVYGNSALVTAVNLFSQTIIKKREENLISINLSDLNLSESYSLIELENKSRVLENNYDLFVKGRKNIRQIVSSPADVFSYLIYNFIHQYNVETDTSIDITVNSELPLHSGMGSSASTIISLLKGLDGYYSVSAKPEQLYDLGLEGEKFIHGYTSGVDPYVALFGGLNRFQQKKAKRLDTHNIPMYIVNTGTPAASTGESVEYVAKHFSKSSIWNDFQSVTDDFEKAYEAQNYDRLIKTVRENHRLLSQIGVVPPATREFITQIENLGGAAKISGAGSVRGQNAGIVLIFSTENSETLCKKFGYELVAVNGEPQGARIV